MFNVTRATRFMLVLINRIDKDNLFHGAAALGFYLTLAIFPALTLMMTIIPYLPVDNVGQAIMDTLSQALPAEASVLVAEVVKDVTTDKRGGLLSFSLLGTIWATSSGMYAVMRQLNVTYRAGENRSFLKARLTALALSFVFGFLIICAFTLIVLGDILGNWLSAYAGLSDLVLLFFTAFRWFTIVFVLLLGFAIIYCYAPNVERKFSFITTGSVIGVVLLILASLAFAYYAGNFANYSATYGSIGAVVSLMFWLFISGFVLLLGSEINMLLESNRTPNANPAAEEETLPSSSVR
jgi:membrane protein